jgi:peptide/nickel transport system permease protein
MTILMVLTLSTLLGPLVYHHRINDIDFAISLQGPSLAHPLGTDDLGQDLLARILYGGRVSMAVGLVAMLIAILIGTAIGATAGYWGGWVDHVLMRLTDLFIALPPFPYCCWSFICSEIPCAGSSTLSWASFSSLSW